MTQCTVAVGTESKLKIRAVKAAFTTYGFDAIIKPCKVSSGVSAQPFGFAEMEAGAWNRAAGTILSDDRSEFRVGIESGIVEQGAQWFDTIAVAVVRGVFTKQLVFSAFFPIPAWMVKRIREEQTELGEIVRSLIGGGEKDVAKYLSDDSVKREEVLEQAVRCALAPLVHIERYTS